MHKRATTNQLRALATYVAEDKKISNNQLSAVFTKKHLHKKWDEIAQKLNAMLGARKSGALWKKTYFDMRWRQKEKRAEGRKRLRKTEGESFKKSNISQAKEMSLTNMGKMVLEGHLHQNVKLEDEVSNDDGQEKDQNEDKSKTGCSWMIDSYEQTLLNNEKLNNSIAQREKFNRLQEEQNEEMKNYHMVLLKIKQEKNDILREQNILLQEKNDIQRQQNGILLRIAEALMMNDN